MDSPASEHRTVFISYVRYPPEHAARVQDLANRLRAKGIDCRIPEDTHSPSQEQSSWLADQIHDADVVLVVCTEAFTVRFHGKRGNRSSGGATPEGVVLTEELYEAEPNKAKFIPVLLSSQDWSHVPPVLRKGPRYNLDTPEGCEALILRLSQPLHPPTPERITVATTPGPEDPGDPEAVPWNVPYCRNRFFTGREEVLDQMQKNLASAGAAALTQPREIGRFGGIGKTQTAVEYAYLHRGQYRAVLWARAHSRDALVADTVATARLVGLPEKPSQASGSSVAAVRRWLERTAGWLLILDSADDPALVEDLVPRGHRGHLLLISGPQGWDGVGVANPIVVDAWLPVEAGQFLLKRTGRQDLQGAESNAVDQLAQELDGLPLALEQAGAYIAKSQCDFQEYLFLYRRHGLDLMERPGSVTGKYPPPVATACSLTIEHVTQQFPASADLLRASAFLDPDAIPLELIARGCEALGPSFVASLSSTSVGQPALEEVLEPLVDYSLVSRTSDPRTYCIHRFIQAVVRDSLSKAVQRQWAERAVRAMERAFPEVALSTWDLCERFLPHAEACVTLIQAWDVKCEEAEKLLTRLWEYARQRSGEAHAAPIEGPVPAGEEAALLTPDPCEAMLGPADAPGPAPAIEPAPPSDHAPAAPQNLAGEAEPLVEQTQQLETPLPVPDAPVPVDPVPPGSPAIVPVEGSQSPAMATMATAEPAPEPRAEDMAAFLEKQAADHIKENRSAEAMKLYRRSLAIREEALGPDHPVVASSLDKLAALCLAEGRSTEAKQLYKRALAIREKVLGSEHLDIAANLDSLAALCQTAGRAAEAKQLYTRALAIREKTLGPDHPVLATNLDCLAALYNRQGRYAEAERLYKRSLAIREKNLGPNHPDVAITLNHYITLLRKWNRDAEACVLETRVKKIRQMTSSALLKQ
ncbi:MAG: tetratricopeptide repeat protein [Nitrospirae bacterium]|nr:tetratricopeptide repeat protein [Nitrospirota bacterium]